MITIGVVVLKFANSMYLKYEGIKVNKFSFIARIYTCSTNEKSKLSCAHIFSNFQKILVLLNVNRYSGQLGNSYLYYILWCTMHAMKHIVHKMKRISCKFRKKIFLLRINTCILGPVTLAMEPHPLVNIDPVFLEKMMSTDNKQRTTLDGRRWTLIHSNSLPEWLWWSNTFFFM